MSPWSWDFTADRLTRLAADSGRCHHEPLRRKPRAGWTQPQPCSSMGFRTQGANHGEEGSSTLNRNVCTG